MNHITEIYEALKSKKIEAAFVGKESIKDYLCYVLGNDIQMACYRDIADLEIKEDVCIVDFIM